ncbi:MAG: hypothetical protein HY026_01405 [Deltaproteobacteria bacterium]|nr:hypothetical protein [Deltaproteobacteria bacterium]
MVTISHRTIDSLNIENFFNIIREKIIEFWKGQRLRDHLIRAFLFGIFLLSTLLMFVPKYSLTITPFFIGILLGIPLGMISIVVISKNIKNNFYYYLKGKVFSLKKIALGILIVLACQLINVYIDEFHGLTYFYLPIAVAFPISIFIPLLWLIKYEKKYGAVYIVKTGQEK